MEELWQHEKSRQQRILKAKEDLATAELELQNLPPYEVPKDEIVSFIFYFECLFLVAVHCVI